MLKYSKFEPPPQLTKEVSDWAINIWSNRLLEEINYYLFRYKSRLSDSNTAENLINSEEFQIVKLFLMNYDIEHNLLRLLESQDIRIRIPIYSYATDIFKLPGHIEYDNLINDIFLLNIRLLESKQLSISLEYKFNSQTYSIDSVGRADLELLELKKHSKNILYIMNKFNDFIADYSILPTTIGKKLLEMKIESLKYVKEKLPLVRNKNTFQKEFTFKINDSEKYFIKNKNIEQMLGTSIRVFFTFSKELSKSIYNQEWQGLWVKDQNVIWIYRDDSQIIKIIESINSRSIRLHIEDLAKTIRHELQHALQTYIKTFKQLNEEGGLPSKKIREKDVNIHGFPQQTQQPTERKQHELRDIEFFTNLQDIIDTFKSVMKIFPKKLLGNLLKTFIAQQQPKFLFAFFDTERIKSMPSKNFLRPIEQEFYYEASNIVYANSFFEKLKTNPEKYNRAVKELYKQVSSLI